MCLYASSCTHTHIDCWCGVHSGVAIFTQSELSLNNSKQDGPWCHLREHDEISHQCVVKSPPTAAHHTYAPQSARRRPRMDRPTKQPEGVVSRRVTAGHNGSQRVSIIHITRRHHRWSWRAQQIRWRPPRRECPSDQVLSACRGWRTHAIDSHRIECGANHTPAHPRVRITAHHHHPLHPLLASAAGGLQERGAT